MSGADETVIGRIPVLEVLRAGKRPARKLYVLQDAKDIGDILAAAAAIPVEHLSRAELDRLARGATHQGVVLRAAPLPLTPIEHWLATAPADAVVVILDGIEDPHNFGAIIRSAAACRASAVLFGKDRAAPLSPASLKAAAGAAEHIHLVRVTNLARAIDTLRKSGFWVAALDADAPQLLWEGDLRGRIGLVVGNEGRGIRRLIREKCDFCLRIPLQGPVSSLNASVSVGIALAECLRQRHKRSQ